MSSSEHTPHELLIAYIEEYRKLEGKSKHHFDQMANSLTSPFRVAARQCEDLRTAVVQCYDKNKAEVFVCSDDVEKFSRCSRELYGKHVEMVKQFQLLREEHEKKSAPQLA